MSIDLLVIALVNVLVIVVPYNSVYAFVFPLTKCLLQSKPTYTISPTDGVACQRDQVRNRTDDMQVFTTRETENYFLQFCIYQK